jgi:hypothetical protein
MKKYQELENKIQELQKEVERLKQEEKAEQVDLSTCIVGQLVQLRNGEFACFQCKDGAFYVVGGLTYEKDGRQHNYALERDYDVVKVFPAEIRVPDDFSVSDAKEVLNGDIKYLIPSFSWCDTPQGYHYWNDISYGESALTLCDVIQIQKWIIQSP